MDRVPDGLFCFPHFCPLPRKCAIFYFIFLGNSSQGLNCILAWRQQTKLSSEPKSASSSVTCIFCLPSVLREHEKPRRHKAKWATEVSAGGLGAGLTWSEESCSSQGTVVTHRQQWWLHPQASFVQSQSWGRQNLNWNLEGAPPETFSLPCSCPGPCPKQQVVSVFF